MLSVLLWCHFVSVVKHDGVVECGTGVMSESFALSNVQSEDQIDKELEITNSISEEIRL